MIPGESLPLDSVQPHSGSHMVWRAGRFRFQFPGPVLIMGVLNVTPDSFSDGGCYTTPQTAVERALTMVEEGAGLVDVGGESTRPGAQPVTEEEERRRVLPVIEQLVNRTDVPISVDTRKPAVARDAVKAGASVINDVGANRDQPEAMWEVVAQTEVGYVSMHMQGSPTTMQRDPQYANVVEEVERFFFRQLAGLERVGAHTEQVVLDIGIGFGKTPAHNLQLLAALGRFTRLKRPLLVGASRKSFIGKLFGAELMSRLPGSLACACWAALMGAHLIRVHDVSETVQAVRMSEAIANAARRPQGLWPNATTSDKPTA